jgi:hypothetical protein
MKRNHIYPFKDIKNVKDSKNIADDKDIEYNTYKKNNKDNKDIKDIKNNILANEVNNFIEMPIIENLILDENGLPFIPMM